MKAVEAFQAPVRGAEVWPLSVAAYHALGEAGLMPERTELLYGFVYHKMSKSPLHTFLMLRLLRLLQAVLPPDLHLRPEQPLTCVDSEPELDLAVVRGAEEDFRLAHPRTAELVIEVSVTSADYDRSKLRAYASAGVKECWLVLGREKQIEVHREPAEGEFAQRTLDGPGARLTSTAIPSFTVDLSKLFEPETA
jgi:Uma2 family endonuclease